MNNLFPIAFLDAPEILNATITPIPGAGSPPLQVVVDLGTRAAHAIAFIDTTGDWIGVYTGAVGSEVLKCIIGGGLNSSTPVVLAAHSRISLRSMTTSAITNGQLTCTFLGMGFGPGAS